jgi:predicted enzyme involved in methoxymalonyl-ACP biosynthesis
MSCRVLKRDMELAMLDALIEKSRSAGIQRLIGNYIPTKKNAMVADHYKRLGFEPVSVDPDTNATAWNLDISSYTPRNCHIRILEPVHG